MDRLVDETMLPMESLLSDPIIDKDQRAGVASSCSKLVTQYKFDLLCLNLQAMQIIRRGYQRKLSDLLHSLSASDWDGSIKQAIIDRQNTMMERHEVYLAHRLNTFFVDAPMV